MGVMGQRGRAGVIAVLLAALCSCSGSRPGTPTGGARSTSPVSWSGATVVTKFSPYSASGALAVAVQDHASGYCWTGSIEVPVAGAYRCLVGNDIADPCFAPPRAGTPPTVACLADPWSAARVVALTRALPGVEPVGNAANPWAVQLANGVRCVAVTGTVQSVEGVSLNLSCPGGTVAGALDNSGPAWHVKYGTATGLSLVVVVAAWRG